MTRKEVQEKFNESIRKFLEEEVKKTINDHDSKPNEFKSAKKIIAYWSRVNAGISGGMALVPGPLGMVGALPTLIAEIRNQICMLKDIATFYGKQDQFNMSIALLIMFYSTGNAGGKFLVIKGGQVLLAKAAPKVIQKVLIRLSIRLSQRAIGKLCANWVPVLGSATLGAWSYASSTTIGKFADTIFSKEIKNVDVEDDSEFDIDEQIKPENELYNVSLNTCKAMVEMMYADNIGSVEEMKVVLLGINDMVKSIPEIESTYQFSEIINEYMIKYKDSHISDTDYSVFINSPDYQLNLISLLVAVAKASEGVNSDEICFIQNVCLEIGYDFKTAMSTLLSD